MGHPRRPCAWASRKRLRLQRLLSTSSTLVLSPKPRRLEQPRLWGQILTQPLASCVTWDETLNFLGFHFLIHRIWIAQK